MHILLNSSNNIAVQTGTYPNNVLSMYAEIPDIPSEDIVGTTILNHEIDIVGDYAAGESAITVSDASSFSAGELVMIVQMQIYRYVDNPTSPTLADMMLVNNELGKYEICQIDTIAGDIVTLKNGLTYSYLSDSGAYANTNTRTQMVNIPIYNNINFASTTLTCNAWDGLKGGIVAVKSNSITGTGTITVAGKGYRGGRSDSTDGERIYAEGWMGNHAKSGNSAPYKQGAGGYYSSGGAHRNNGVTTASQHGGLLYGSSNLLNTVHFGCGGGSGPFYADNRRSGGYGGGIVILIANSISSNITISANGTGGGLYDGFYGSGGGAGGAILIRHTTFAGTYSIAGGAGAAGGGDGSVGYYLNTLL